ncbi:MAG: hypothetical protein ACKOYH_06335 [Cyanobium sp.]
MNQPLPPWSLHWSSNGELSPLDRADLAHLFLALHHPPLTARQGISSMGTAQAQIPSRIYYFPTVKT